MTTSEECPGCGSAEHEGDACPFEKPRPAVLGVPNAMIVSGRRSGKTAAMERVREQYEGTQAERDEDPDWQPRDE